MIICHESEAVVSKVMFKAAFVKYLSLHSSAAVL